MFLRIAKSLFYGVVTFFLSFTVLSFVGSMAQLTDPGPGQPPTPLMEEFAFGALASSVVLGAAAAWATFRRREGRPSPEPKSANEANGKCICDNADTTASLD